ncbi:hypothetical protein [Flavitalea sp.]|nr:hypothetical protein [Flavitalea sp.]
MLVTDDKVNDWIESRPELLSEATRKAFTNDFLLNAGLIDKFECWKYLKNKLYFNKI